MFNLGTPELILILFIALLIFGPRKLPEMGKAIGKAVKEFKKGMQGVTEELEKEVKEVESQAKSLEGTITSGKTEEKKEQSPLAG